MLKLFCVLVTSLPGVVDCLCLVICHRMPRGLILGWALGHLEQLPVGKCRRSRPRREASLSRHKVPRLLILPDKGHGRPQQTVFPRPAVLLSCCILCKASTDHLVTKLSPALWTSTYSTGTLMFFLGG